MKNHNRQAKPAALKAVLNGNKDALAQYQQRFAQQVFVVQFVDYSQAEGEPLKPLQSTDLVDTRLPGEQGQTRMTYAEFLNNPALYGHCCFPID